MGGALGGAVGRGGAGGAEPCGVPAGRGIAGPELTGVPGADVPNPPPDGENGPAGRACAGGAAGGGKLGGRPATGIGLGAVALTGGRAGEGIGDGLGAAGALCAAELGTAVDDSGGGAPLPKSRPADAADGCAGGGL